MTPTSATGPDASRAGLTLVELMIVMVIMGLAGAAVVMTLPDGQQGPGHEAEVFAARLTRARDEAILTNRTIEAVADEAGYAFRVRRAGEREALETPPFEPVRWPEDVIGQDAVFIFDPTGAAEPAELVLSGGTDHVSISVDAAGEVSLRAG